jgi:hypothetical protein
VVSGSGLRAMGVVVAVTTGLALGGCSRDGEATETASPTASSSVSASVSPSPTPTPTTTLQSVGEIYRQARTAALAAPSGHVVGTQTREGRAVTVDVEGNASGSNQTVFITTPEGGQAEVITVDTDHWLGGDEAFWVEQTGDPGAGRDMVGKYVAISESDATELGSFTLRTMLAETFDLPEFAAMESDSSPVEEGEVDGRAVFVLGEPGGAQLWVLADGSAALVRAVGPKTAPADLVFTDWGRAQTFTPPPPSMVVEG